jgi:hypothetical protein
VSRSLRLFSPTFRLPHRAPGALLFVLTLCLSSRALAAEPIEPLPRPPERSDGWNRATNIMALSSAAVQILMPRVFYSDPEVTVGWKARWHVSVLAPSMTLFALSLVNEEYLKDAFESLRPDCENDYRWRTCREYGLFSTQSMLAFSSLGQGTGIFLVDTIKWSDGRFNVGGLVGNVGVPLVLSVLTAVGRSAGNWESAGQVWTSAGVGVGVGLGMGVLYALAQRPECGYSGGLICW